ncbi:hypothetical protein HPB50_009049 [Hyalomma asiaticum]|uniref:Uncharacterized protein n=1 Tax=Hyalomma asiaticum TaxID=266040 RepID=A0ACB7SCY5_HYAAI|nr:hypothetical protein HPB50_009049 [Hyalomma asiaticum]
MRANARSDLVFWDGTRELKATIKAAFSRIGDIPGVLGCVDGTLIGIQKPHGLGLGDTQNYFSRKGFYAMNTMIVCDADLWILHVNPCFPGSCHDSMVWRRDPLRHQLEAELRPGEYLLEDEGEEPPPYEQATGVDRPPSPDQPQSPVWAPTQQDITLRGQLHRNRVVNLFRVHRTRALDD